jgi:hypothetical protein
MVLEFEAAGIGHTFVIGLRPNAETETGTWIGWLERKRGLIGSILGGRRRGIQASAAHAIHQILTGSPVIRGVRWHFQRDFDNGVERGTSSPLTRVQPSTGHC